MQEVYSGLKVVGWHLMVDTWWDKVKFLPYCLGPS